MSDTNSKENVCLKVVDLDQNIEQDGSKMSESNTLIGAKEMPKNSSSEQNRANEAHFVSSR